MQANVTLTFLQVSYRRGHPTKIGKPALVLYREARHACRGSTHHAPSNAFPVVGIGGSNVTTDRVDSGCGLRHLRQQEGFSDRLARRQLAGFIKCGKFRLKMCRRPFAFQALQDGVVFDRQCARLPAGFHFATGLQADLPPALTEDATPAGRYVAAVDEDAAALLAVGNPFR